MAHARKPAGARVPPATPPRPELRFRVWSPSVLLAGLAAVIVVLTALRRGRFDLEVALELAICAAGAASTIAPLTGGVVALAILGVLGLDPSSSVGLGANAALIPIVSARLAGRPRLRWGLAAGAYLLLLLLTVRTLDPGESLFDYGLYWLIWVVAALLAGEAYQAAMELADRRWAERLEAQRHSIARDLHDTVARSLSSIVMRAEQARLRGSTDDGDLQFIVHTADCSISDLRLMLTMLRSGSDPDASEPWLIGPIDSVLDACSEELRRNAFTAAIDLQGDIARLSDSASRALAKVAHEATSNVVRHGEPGSSCVILLHVGDAEAELLVTNVPRSTRSEPEPGRLGIIGMQERIRALDGHFTAGHSGDRWVVHATLPLADPDVDQP